MPENRATLWPPPRNGGARCAGVAAPRGPCRSANSPRPRPDPRSPRWAPRGAPRSAHSSPRDARAGGRGQRREADEGRAHRHGAEAGQRFAGKGARVPAAGVDARKLGPVALTGHTALGRGAVQLGVVQQEGHAVGAELHVALEGAVTVRGTDTEGGQRVLRRQFAGAAVGNPEGQGPVWLHATRCPLWRSNQCRCSRGTCRCTVSPGRGGVSVASRRTVNAEPPRWP